MLKLKRTTLNRNHRMANSEAKKRKGYAEEQYNELANKEDWIKTM